MTLIVLTSLNLINKINKDIFLSDSSSIEFKYFSGETTLFLSLDSDSRIFNFKYTNKKGVLDSKYEFLGHVIMDLKIDFLLYHLSEIVVDEIKKNPEVFAVLGSQFDLDVATLNVREALYHYKGEVRELAEVKGLDKDSLICRCNSIDRAGLKKLSITHAGNENEIMLNSKISLICGGCRPLFHKEMKEIAKEIEFDKVQIALGDFVLVSPPDFNNVVLELVSSSLPQVNIQINDNPESISKDRIGETLQSYLQSELKNKLVILCLNSRQER